MKSKPILQYVVLIFLVALSFNATAGNSARYSGQQPDNIVGAVCVIRNGDNLIMLLEAITNKLSLPGGYIDSGDTPQEAAAREALEEAGIEVEVEHLIQYRDRAAIYACRAKSPIPVSSFRDSRGYPIVASWFAEHFATEVERVYLIDPSLTEAREHRYAEDAALLPQWLASTPDSEVKVYDRFDYDISPLHEYELGLIGQFQQGISTWSSSLQWLFGSLMHALAVLGGPWFVFVALALMAGYYRTRFFLDVACLILVTLFGASLLEHGLMMPRPFFIIPDLQKVNAPGFGFPSEQVLMTSLLFGVWGYLLQRQVKTKQQKVMIALLVVLVVAGQGAAGVWFGVHFISDVIMSMMLGFAMVAIFILWRSDTFRAYRQLLTSRWFWLGLGILTGAVAGISLVPAQAYLCSLLLGIFFGINYALKVDQITPQLSAKRRFAASIGVLLGAVGISGAMMALAAVQSSTLMVLGIKTSGYLLLGAWLVCGSSWLRQQLSR